MLKEYLRSLSEDINHHFHRQANGDLLHGLYTPPVCLQHQNVPSPVTLNPLNRTPIMPRCSPYLIIVAFGEKQSAQFSVKGSLVSMVAVFG